MSRSTLAALGVLAVSACGGGHGSPEDATPDRVQAGDGGLSQDAGASPDAGTPPRDGGSPDGGNGSNPGELRFVVLGDTGEGNQAQREVAVAMRDLCAAEGCDFVVLLGDNIYDSGAASPDDPQWITKFEQPYRDVDLPFYAVLGNHDYGGEDPIFHTDQGGLGNEFDKGLNEVRYTSVSEKWTMPATHYTFQMGTVGFVMLDTNSILWDDTRHGDQWAWYPTAVSDLEASGAEWIIVAGHHPYRSNGAHGDAGNYESFELGGVEIPNPVPIMDGANVKAFFEQEVCGTAHVAFAGHDHNRQWLDESRRLCGAELIVSGAGAKTQAFSGTTNTLVWGDDMVEGFLYVVIEGERMYGRFVDRNGALAFEQEVVRPALP